MRRSITLFVALTVAACLSDAAQAAGQSAQPVQLFNGQNLAGWDFYLVEPNVKMEDVWSVRDGILICKGEPMGYLCTKNQYTSFKLIVEWRWAPGTEPGNSGVLMRITGKPKALPKCVEAQLKHGDAGALYGFHGFKVDGEASRFISGQGKLTGKLTGLKKIKGNEKPPGEWNRYEITFDGGSLATVVNGRKVNEATGCDVTAGKIGFQSEGGQIHFRKIELIPIQN